MSSEFGEKIDALLETNGKALKTLRFISEEILPGFVEPLTLGELKRMTFSLEEESAAGAKLILNMDESILKKEIYCRMRDHAIRYRNIYTQLVIDSLPAEKQRQFTNYQRKKAVDSRSNWIEMEIRKENKLAMDQKIVTPVSSLAAMEMGTNTFDVQIIKNFLKSAGKEAHCPVDAKTPAHGLAFLDALGDKWPWTIDEDVKPVLVDALEYLQAHP